MPLPTGEGGHVRVHEPKRLRPLTQEAVDDGGLAFAIWTGEEDEGGHEGTLSRKMAGCPHFSSTGMNSDNSGGKV